jgi:hypothetical protein
MLSRDLLEEEDTARPDVPRIFSALLNCCSCEGSCPGCVLFPGKGKENFEFLPIASERCPSMPKQRADNAETGFGSESQNGKSLVSLESG